MEAIVLAGGFGIRLRSVVREVPKVMAQVGKRPFLEIVLSKLEKQGFKRVILSLGYMADKIIAYFGHNFFGMELVYQIEDQPLGTGGAIRFAMTRCLSDHVYIFNGDTYIEVETKVLEKLWQYWNQPIIVAREVQDTMRYGRMKTDNQKVIDFEEKEKSGPGLINAGCYLFPVQIVKKFPKKKNFSIEHEFLPEIVKKETIHYIIAYGKFIDIGIPEDYQRAQNELLAEVD